MNSCNKMGGIKIKIKFGKIDILVSPVDAVNMMIKVAEKYPYSKW